jgi:hypothetical protein
MEILTLRLQETRARCSCARSEIRLQNQLGVLLITTKFASSDHFACKDKRHAPRAPENNNEYQAENKSGGHGQEHLCLVVNPGRAAMSEKTKPGAVSRPDTLREFQFHEYYDSTSAVNTSDRFSAMWKPSFRGREAQPDVPVGCRDKLTQCNGVHVLRPAELHVPHAFAGAFQEAGRVVKHRPVEEADIHVRPEGVDVPERRVSHTRRGMAVVQQLANVRSAGAHLLKPWPRERSQLVIRFGKPSLDAGVSMNGTREAHELAHPNSLQANVKAAHSGQVASTIILGDPCHLRQSLKSITASHENSLRAIRSVVRSAVCSADPAAKVLYRSAIIR